MRSKILQSYDARHDVAHIEKRVSTETRADTHPGICTLISPGVNSMFVRRVNARTWRAVSQQI